MTEKRSRFLFFGEKQKPRKYDGAKYICFYLMKNKNICSGQDDVKDGEQFTVFF
jgi:hypothetical protein